MTTTKCKQKREMNANPISILHTFLFLWACVCVCEMSYLHSRRSAFFLWHYHGTSITIELPSLHPLQFSLFLCTVHNFWSVFTVNRTCQMFSHFIQWDGMCVGNSFISHISCDSGRLTVSYMSWATFVYLSFSFITHDFCCCRCKTRKKLNKI